MQQKVRQPNPAIMAKYKPKYDFASALDLEGDKFFDAEGKKILDKIKKEMNFKSGASSGKAFNIVSYVHSYG